MKTLIRTLLLAGCLKKHKQNLFGFDGVSAMKQRGSFALVMAAAFIAAATPDAQAVNFLWNNSGSQWTNGASWTNGVAPTSISSTTTTDDVQFGNYGANNNTVVLALSRAAASMSFLAGANAYNINSFDGTQNLLISKGLTNSSTATQTFGISVAQNFGDYTWTQVTGGSLVFNNNVGITAAGVSRTLTLAGGGTFTFNAGITSGTSPSSKLTINNAGGTVNLRASNAISGGVTLTAGTLNINNNNALGAGAFTLTGGATVDNTSGSAVVNAGNQAWTWNGISAMNFGSATNTAANNLDLGTGVVSLTGSRTVNLSGTGTKLTIGAATINGNNITANGTGNTLEMRGLSLSTNSTPGTVILDGTANINITGAIADGTAPGSALSVTNTGTNNFSGNNTYTGTTLFQSCRTIISGDNSAAVGNVTISGSSTYVRLDSSNAISRSSSLVGANATIAQSSTLDFKAAGDVTFNSYGLSSSAGGSMNFTNSSGSSKTVTFTNADNYLTQASSGARGLSIKSADLTLDFVGNIQNSSTQTNTTTFDGAGNFIVRGSLLDTTNATGIRTIAKTGAGTLTLLGASNNYSGSTLVSGGTLEVGAAGALPTASAITVSNGATLRFLKSSGGISVGSLTNAGTLEQNLITITNSGAVDLTGSTLKVNGTPTLNSYTLVSGTSLTGTPTLSSAIPNYKLSNSATSLLLVKKVTPVIVVTPGSYTYTGSTQGPGTAQVSTGGSTSTPSLTYSGTTSSGSTYGPSSTPPTAPGSYTVTATTAEDPNYLAGTSSVTAFTIEKATPSITATPAASDITYGQTLADSNLTGGTASTPGSFAFTTPSTAPSVGTANQGVTFTPSDTANYNTATTSASVTVNAADPLADYMSGFGLTGASAEGSADPDGDGQDNNAELAFGTDPTNGASRAATLVSGTDTIKLVYLQRNSGVTYTVKSLPDLATAFDSGITVTPTVSADQNSKPSGYTRYEATLDTGSTVGFLRVRAVR